jgi:hypothetical protein
VSASRLSAAERGERIGELAGCLVSAAASGGGVAGDGDGDRDEEGDRDEDGDEDCDGFLETGFAVGGVSIAAVVGEGGSLGGSSSNETSTHCSFGRAVFSQAGIHTIHPRCSASEIAANSKTDRPPIKPPS